MGKDIHEVRRRNGQTDSNPLAKKFDTPEAARRFYSSYDYPGSEKKSSTNWRYYKAKAIEKRIRRSWYGPKY